MCHPAWGKARLAAQRVSELARLRRVRDRIDREYALPLNVEALAGGARMSAGHLSRRFRAAYGESPYSYLTTRRIERAKALLRRGDLSVTEVRFAVGRPSAGAFSTRFSELVGMSPRTYRSAAAESTAGTPPCADQQGARAVKKKNTGPATGRTDAFVLLLGAEDVVASKRFYTERDLIVARSFAQTYVEFADDSGPSSWRCTGAGPSPRTPGSPLRAPDRTGS